MLKNYSSIVSSPAAVPGLAPMFDTAFYFQPVSYFYQCYGKLPRRLNFQLAGKEARQTLLEQLAPHYDLDAATVVHTQSYEKAGEGPETLTTALLLAPELLLLFGDRSGYGDRGAFVFYSPETDPDELARVTGILQGLLDVGEQERHRIHVLRLAFNDLEFTPLSIKIPELDLSSHYNDDLLPVHDTIVHRLRQPQDKGIVILHGQPGTGKTSYIRHLCGLTDKPKLFIPPNLAARIADPEFINLLHDNTNSVLLIEDAEELLLKRDGGRGGSAVSNLLNLSDGLLADCFHIQIVCTFNTDLARIDSALLRKGRLIAAYHFQPLAQDKAQALATSLGQTEPVTSPLALADIYNRDAPRFDSSAVSTRIGFSR
ncbi:ATP-binding protein [Hymenobacter weizhouensis]|uniref:ATP-binding protein n=1 Tax=Hymenobacter sp. YIM 151500-1 TaxID=2987689 RepID=UPI002225C696|nr:ATP-binding protein [Hymenobacter sp. YIM 151500-1]UYZ61681.1 ATP-binding protein [Hymenobacter sp. YIM 151500-1]